MSIDERKEEEARAEILKAKVEWERTFDAVPDLIAIIDNTFRITRINKAMADRLGISKDVVTGKKCHEIVHKLGKHHGACPFALLLADGKIHSAEILEKNLNGTFLVTTSPIYDAAGTITGTVHIMHDVTESRRAEDAIRIANKKLNMLSSITRHDILNQVMGLRAFLEISKETEKDPVRLEYIEKEVNIAEAIARQIEFTRYYQDIGVEVPVWHHLRTIIMEQAGQLNLAGIALELPEKDIQVFADPLIGKVFYNLIENSLRHGGRLTRIGFSVREHDSGAIIIYWDDGVGISSVDKAKLFTRGFGKHTGLGLFLSREILAITGITIAENGEPGKGVRFEIAVPKNAYLIDPSLKES
jgi:PAS domain S-box-containing protein